MANSFKKKLVGCTNLVSLKQKKIKAADIAIEAKNQKIPYSSLKSAWKNFQQTAGKVDLRYTKMGHGKKLNIIPKTPRIGVLNTSIGRKKAGRIIREYMTSNDLSSVELCNKYEIRPDQLYGWIKELNTSGRIMGKKVLDPSKYAKVNVLDVIWMYKHPNTRRQSIQKLHDYQRTAYARVADVLLDYLP